jgi:hypothetical protein
MARPRHPDKDIEAAVSFAIASGWHYVLSNGHAWCKLYCPNGQRSHHGCILQVWFTPKNPHRFAQQIWRRVKKCPH